MAVVQMGRIHVYALKRDRKQILEYLQRRGTVEVSTSGLEDETYQKADTSKTQDMLTKNAATAAEAVEIVNRFEKEDLPSLGFLRGRKAISKEQSDAFLGRYDEVLRQAQKVHQLDRDIAEAKAEIVKAEGRLEALRPWLGLPVPMNFTGTKKTAVFVGTLEGEYSLEEILRKLAEAAPDLGPVHVEIVSTAPELTALYAVAMKQDGPALEEALRAIGFARPASSSRHVPGEAKARLEADIQKQQQLVDEAGEEIKRQVGLCDDFRMLEDHAKMRAEKYGVIEKLAQSKHVFMMDGYLPAELMQATADDLQSRFDCIVETRELVEQDDEPVLLRNKWFMEPVEGIVESYSLPGRGEVDPTSVMAFFYYIMFGLMFSDAAYGLIMFGVCLFALLRFKNMEPNWSRNVRLFMWCGLSTTFWGVVFSSYFGDVVSVVSRTFFGQEVVIPPLSPPLANDPMLLLVFCLGIGVLHLTAGYIMKGVTCAKNKDYAGVLFDSVLPIFAWYPLVIILMGSAMFENLAGFKLDLPPVATTVCLAITGVCVLGVTLTGGRESKNWGKRLLKGLYADYNLLSGWLSDTLSYSRLLALGLATGVIASVMNQMGAMVGRSVPGVIVFVIVFAVGQTLNFAINALGAYVHSNRLEYVEFFSKFYDGGGRKFEPFGIHTKHYKLTEEETSK